MPKKTATRKRVKAVKRQVSSIDTTLKDTVDSNSEKNWDLDFKINEDFKLTPNQVEFLVKSLQQDTRMCMVDGPAGTAKTYLAVLTALKMLNRKQIENIIYIRSIVESASRSMGALPGELEEKFAPWSMPLVDKLEEITTAGAGSNILNAFDDQSCVDNGITTFRFDEDDIVRSEILRFIVKRLNTIH